MSDVTEIAGNLIVEEKKILLLYRKDEGHWEAQRSQGESCSTSDPAGYWKLPGGKVEENESPTEAAVREAREEIGLEVSLEKPFYSGEFQKDDELFLWHCYQASIEGEPEIKDADCSCGESACSSNPEECCEDKFERLEWFKASELDDLELASNIEMILPALRKI